jgi:polyisoprenoid-binding protein YceI
MRRSLLLASLLASSLFAANATPLTYKLDPNHTIVLAQWNHFGYSHPVANFGQPDGTLVYDADNVAASSVNVTLPMAGLDALVPDLTEHLRSPDFFDAAQWPNATFKSTKVEKISDTKLKVTGDLTLRDVTKPVVLDVTLNKAGEGRNGQPKIGFEATTTIQRSAWGIAKFIPNVADDVQIRITSEALVPKAEGATQ